jgi:hypothetical protein
VEKLAQKMGYLGNLQNCQIKQSPEIRSIWDLCYDFKNIFGKKFSEKIVVFDLKQS